MAQSSVIDRNEGLRTLDWDGLGCLGPIVEWRDRTGYGKAWVRGRYGL